MKKNRKREYIFFVVIILSFVVFAQKGESGDKKVLKKLEKRIEELEKYKINQEKFNERINERIKELNNEKISANTSSIGNIEGDLNDINNAFLRMQNSFSKTNSIIKRLENEVPDKDALWNLKTQIDKLESRPQEKDWVNKKITDINERLEKIEVDLVRSRMQKPVEANQQNPLTLTIIIAVVAVVVILVLLVFRRKDVVNNKLVEEPVRTKTNEEIEEMLLYWWNMDGGKGIEACEVSLKRIDFSICWTLPDSQEKDKWQAIAVKNDYKGDILFMVIPKGLVKYSLIANFFHHKTCEGISDSSSYVNVESMQKPAIIEMVDGDINENTVKKGKVVISYKDNKIGKRSSWNLVRNVINSYKSNKIEIFLESKDFKDRLVVWWKANCETSISDCKKSLKTEFREFEDDVSGYFDFDIRPKDKGAIAEWSYIFVSINKTQELYYLLPCKGLRFSGYIKKYFDNVSSFGRSNISETSYENVYSLKNVAKIRKIVLKNKNSRPEDYELIEKGTVALVLKRKHEEVTPEISQLPAKEATEKDLIDWWGSNGNKGFEEVEKSLRIAYGTNIKIELILGQKENEDNWNLIGLMKKNNTDFFYVLPRKYLFVREVQDWFDVQGVDKGNASERVYIKDIKKTARIEAEELEKFKNIQDDSDTIVKVIIKENGIVELENE
ncbi:MAG: hypothetical protein ACUZ8O_07085 [Candidatus Anammoxibacter sp.]